MFLAEMMILEEEDDCSQHIQAQDKDCMICDPFMDMLEMMTKK